MNDEQQPETNPAEDTSPAGQESAADTPADAPVKPKRPRARKPKAAAEPEAAPPAAKAEKPAKAAPRPRRPRKAAVPVEAVVEEVVADEAAVLPTVLDAAPEPDPIPEPSLVLAETVMDEAAVVVPDAEPEVETVPEPEPEPAAEVAPEPRSSEEASAEEAGEPETGARGILPPNTSAERLLLQLAEREVSDAGEPIPLLRRDAAFAGAGRDESDRLLEAVLVPEATDEQAPPAFADLASPAAPQGLPEFTPELLASVRAEGRPSGRGGRERGPRPPAALPQAAPAPPAAPTEPDLILVPEALLESVPEEWLEEDESTEEGLGGLPATTGPGGRRKRRRGRDRDRERPEEKPAAPAAPAPKPVVLSGPVAPISNVVRAEDEAQKDRDREKRDREPRPEQREYKEILVNVGERETRIGVLENGRLVELHVEREERVVGGVYKGRVSNVLPGMDAAFVDIGLERNAFLYVGDILFEDTSGRGGGDGAPVRRTSRDIRIKDVAKPGQEILVQVVKGPRGTKGARVSTKISIPGRYLVLMPEGDHMGVSRKIDDVRERDRLKKIAEQLKPKGFGLIVRTEAEGRSELELHQDLDYLVKSWQDIVEKNRRAHAPAILHKDLGIILKTIRDLFGSDVDKLVIDSQDEYENAIDMLTQLAPDLADRVYLYEEPEPILIRYNVEEEIDRLLRRKVWLRNGAYLLLDTTEALTTIDVNTGKFVGSTSLAETILKTNLDAVDEIARQLRLRDIGGMIVLDFIDMSSARDRQLVMRKLEDAFKKDRTRIKIAHISPLGLVEMTRKRTAENVTDVMSQTCPYCQGRGRVWSPETMAIQIEREVLRLCAKQEVEAVLIQANAEVAAWLIGAEGEGVEQLERMIRRPVYIRSNPEFHVEKYEIQPGDMLEMERQMMAFHGGQIVDCKVTKIDLITPPRSAAWADGYFVDLANGTRYQGQTIRVRLTDVRRSFAIGEPVAPSNSVDRSEPI
jgi:ribonuclease G